MISKQYLEVIHTHLNSATAADVAIGQRVTQVSVHEHLLAWNIESVSLDYQTVRTSDPEDLLLRLRNGRYEIR